MIWVTAKKIGMIFFSFFFISDGIICAKSKLPDILKNIIDYHFQVSTAFPEQGTVTRSTPLFFLLSECMRVFLC